MPQTLFLASPKITSIKRVLLFSLYKIPPSAKWESLKKLKKEMLGG